MICFILDLYQLDLLSNHWYFYLKLFIIQLVSFMKHLTFNDILFNDIIIYIFSIFKDFCNKIANNYKRL